MKAILLNQEQASQVRGGTGLFTLEPVWREDVGYFILGAEVLEDPFQERHRAFLSTLPQAEVSPVVYTDEE